MFPVTFEAFAKAVRRCRVEIARAKSLDDLEKCSRQVKNITRARVYTYWVGIAIADHLRNDLSKRHIERATQLLKKECNRVCTVHGRVTNQCHRNK